MHPLLSIIKDQYNGLNFLHNRNEKIKGRLAIETINEWECHEGEVSNCRQNILVNNIAGVAYVVDAS